MKVTTSALIRTTRMLGISLAACMWCCFYAIASPTTVDLPDATVTLYRDSRALVIGISEYQNSEWIPLPSVGRETQVVKNVLESNGFRVSTAFDLRGSEIRDRLTRFLLSNEEDNSRLVVFFAGHGWTNTKTLEGFLVGRDAPSSASASFPGSLVSMTEIKALAQRSQAKHILFMFDSCFAGSVFLHRSNFRPPPILFLDDALKDARQFITAGDERQVVPRISQFVPALAEAFSNAAADFNRDGLISTLELGMWIKDRVSALGDTTPQVGQLPLKNSVSGNMLFVTRNSMRLASIPKAAASASVSERVQANVGVPVDSRPEFRGLRILYYRKSADGRLVLNTLNRAGIPYEETRALIPEKFPANAVACGPQTPITALRALARELILGGVPLRVILQYGDPKRLIGDLEIISLTKNGAKQNSLDGPLLTLDQIETLKSCPKWLGTKT